MAAVVTERAAPGAPVATLLPGRGYGPQAPLLYYARLLLRGRGWAVRTVDWEKVPGLDPADHSLERPGDLVGTLEVLATVLSRMDAQLTTLAAKGKQVPVLAASPSRSAHTRTVVLTQ